MSIKRGGGVHRGKQITFDCARGWGWGSVNIPLSAEGPSQLALIGGFKEHWGGGAGKTVHYRPETKGQVF